MDLSAIALDGLHQADAQMGQAAVRIASLGASSSDGANLDVVDLSAELVALMSAKNQSAVEFSVLNTAGEMQRNVIDLMA